MDTESANAQDARVEALWRTLDTRNQGRLNLGALKKGLQKLDHRTLIRAPATHCALRGSAALKNADHILSDVMKAVDQDGDGYIQYHGQPTPPTTPIWS